jgi:hypothetical protein
MAQDPRPDRADAKPVAIEHLVAWREKDGPVIVLGLDAACRPVYTAVL